MSGDEYRPILWAVAALHEPVSVGRFASWSLGIQSRYPGRTLAVIGAAPGGSIVLIDPSVERCGCTTCSDANDKILHGEDNWFVHRHMIWCPDCGDKRCPKANWHGNPCAAAEVPA